MPGTQRARQDDVTLSRRRHRRCGARAAEAAWARGRVGLRHQRVPVSAVGGRVQIRDAVRARGGGRGPSASTGPDEDVEPPPEAETNRADHLGGGEGARLLRRALSRPPPRRVPRHRGGPDPCRRRSRTHPHRPLASRTHASARASRRLGRRYPQVDVSNPPRVRRRVPLRRRRRRRLTEPPGISLRQPLREGTPPRRPNSSAQPRDSRTLAPTPDLEPSRRASPGELRRVAPSAPAAPNRSGGSVIRAPVRVRGCTPGQAYQSTAWRETGRIRRRGTATRSCRPRKIGARLGVDRRRRRRWCLGQSENVKAAVAAAREMNRRNVEAARGQSRTQTKLTSSFGRVGDGVGRGRGSAAFATPDSKRRDDVRWEIRRMMAEPPTF